MALIQTAVRPLRSPPIFPEARPFLDALRTLSIPVCILSNIDREDDDARAYKPHPEMFRLGLELLGLDAGEVLHIGESRSSDVAGARAMSIPLAWINRSGRPALGEPTPDYHVRNLTGVMEIFGPVSRGRPAF